ncbi:MAG: hypothetical protein ACRDKJ_02260, partial [Actinomycetota bacterium]
VRFFATDNKDRWTPVGTDVHGEDGRYAVRWKVINPAGSLFSFYAEATDDAGNRAVESIRGLEGIRVGRRSLPAGEVEEYGRSVSFEGKPANKGSGQMGVLPLVPPVAVFLLSGASLRRTAKRKRATELRA